MLGPIGNDILDVGSRKAAMAQEAARAADPMGLGRPGQFEVPNVMDVRVLKIVLILGRKNHHRVSFVIILPRCDFSSLSHPFH